MKTYDEFWKFYLSEHSKPWTRRLHIVGTVAALSWIGFTVASGKPLLALLAIVIGYGPAWISHFFIEGNRPATWKHPWWSLISDFRMLYWYIARKEFPSHSRVSTPRF